tara:strand:+ start:2844 stop:3017 length:174 start_codon:yes stop_codon:yes gene_type:complete
MTKENERCVVKTSFGEVLGTIVKNYEEIGGAEDGAKFQIIKLDNGQTITVKIKEDES